MLSFSICPTAFFMVRFRWGRDPTLRLYDDSFTELPDKSEFELRQLRYRAGFTCVTIRTAPCTHWLRALARPPNRNLKKWKGENYEEDQNSGAYFGEF